MRQSRRVSVDVPADQPAPAISEFAYDENTEQLYVTLSSGGTRVYFPLSARVYGQFYDAVSREAFLSTTIQPRSHDRPVTGIPRRLPREWA